MNYFRYTEDKLNKLVEKGNSEFVLYPFGERGAMIKGILNGLFDINEKAIADNFLWKKNSNVINLCELSKMDLTSVKVLITNDNPSIYYEIRAELYKYIDKEKCIDFFPVPIVISAQQKHKKIEDKLNHIVADKEHLIYAPLNTNALFYLPFYRTDLLQQHVLMSDNYYDNENLEFVCKEFNNGIIKKSIQNGLILDIGANIGNHTLYFCKECGAKVVHAFEPMKKTFDILKENVEINLLEDCVTLYNSGLGNTLGNAREYDYTLTNIGATRLYMDPYGEIQIQVLDEINFSMPITLIKIDVEGMEKDVLEGGWKHITREHPYIMIEIFDPNFPKVSEMLVNVGYQYVKLSTDNYLFYY